MIFEYKKTATLSNLEKELDRVSAQIEKLSLPKGFFQFILYAISELLANVKEHANVGRASMSIKIGNRKCSIYVGDRGVGFRQSYLLKQIYVKDDFSAIEFALSGLSTKQPQERGFGLYSIKKFVEKLEGKMIIKSGLGKVLIQKNKINFQNLKRKVPGVGIEIETLIKKLDFYKIIV